MSAIFDSLGYVRRLEQAGVERVTAEAHADAARDYILAGVATKGDVEHLADVIEASTKELRSEMALLEQRMTIKLGTFLVVAVGAIVALQRLLS